MQRKFRQHIGKVNVGCLGVAGRVVWLFVRCQCCFVVGVCCVLLGYTSYLGVVLFSRVVFTFLVVFFGKIDVVFLLLLFFAGFGRVVPVVFAPFWLSVLRIVGVLAW